MKNHSRQELLDDVNRSIRIGAEFRRRHLSTAEQLDDYLRLTQWQTDYLTRCAGDAFESGEYDDALSFMVEEMAGAHIVERDRQLARVTAKLAKLLPLNLLSALAAALRHNNHLSRLTLNVLEEMRGGGSLPDPITETDYIRAARTVSSYEEALELLDTTLALGDIVESAVRSRWVGAALNVMGPVARAGGYGAIQDVFDNGYRILRDVPDTGEFLARLYDAMRGVFRRVYQSPNGEPGDACSTMSPKVG